MENFTMGMLAGIAFIGGWLLRPYYDKWAKKRDAAHNAKYPE